MAQREADSTPCGRTTLEPNAMPLKGPLDPEARRPPNLDRAEGEEEEDILTHAEGGRARNPTEAEGAGRHMARQGGRLQAQSRVGGCSRNQD